MAEEWKLPSLIIQTVRYHHTPREAQEAWRDCVWLVAIADNFVLSEKIGQSGNRPRSLTEMDSIKPKANGKAPRPSMPTEQGRGLILKDVEQALKGAMVQWEIEPHFQENALGAKGEATPKPIGPNAGQPNVQATSTSEPVPANPWRRSINWLRRVVRFFQIY